VFNQSCTTILPERTSKIALADSLFLLDKQHMGTALAKEDWHMGYHLRSVMEYVYQQEFQWQVNAYC